MFSFLVENKILSTLHMGGVSGNSPINALEVIHDKLLKSRVENTPSILIGLYHTSAFTMINHSILIKKFKHIGFSNKTLDFMKTYLNRRRQSVSFNGSNSDLIDIGDQGCFQGTIMATLIYVIYVLDQPSVAHMSCNHENSYEDNENCAGNLSINYIDDNITEVISDNWNNIEVEAENYLENQKNYHINN